MGNPATTATSPRQHHRGSTTAATPTRQHHRGSTTAAHHHGSTTHSSRPFGRLLNLGIDLCGSAYAWVETSRRASARVSMCRVVRRKTHTGGITMGQVWRMDVGTNRCAHAHVRAHVQLKGLLGRVRVQVRLHARERARTRVPNLACPFRNSIGMATKRPARLLSSSIVIIWHLWSSSLWWWLWWWL